VSVDAGRDEPGPLPPVSWDRALSGEPNLNGREAALVKAWLCGQGWAADHPRFPGMLLDPLVGADQEVVTLDVALSRQAARSAQALLEPRGWRGPGRDDDPWSPSERFQRGAQRFSILDALINEGLAER
jgi:hypothetical protein